jgi:hypothetical protein
MRPTPNNTGCDFMQLIQWRLRSLAVGESGARADLTQEQGTAPGAAFTRQKICILQMAAKFIIGSQVIQVFLKSQNLQDGQIGADGKVQLFWQYSRLNSFLITHSCFQERLWKR